jgi:hypothetical protein
METKEKTVCYTYKVEMIVQVLADSEDKARAMLDDKGGYVTRRKVTVLDSVALHNGDNLKGIKGGESE